MLYGSGSATDLFFRVVVGAVDAQVGKSARAKHCGQIRPTKPGKVKNKDVSHFIRDLSQETKHSPIVCPEKVSLFYIYKAHNKSILSCITLYYKSCMILHTWQPCVQSLARNRRISQTWYCWRSIFSVHITRASSVRRGWSFIPSDFTFIIHSLSKCVEL